tara:strand:+ start:2983 stop:3693 length:711 start_codon:yes stop_codon:yes gene_type:complete
MGFFKSLFKPIKKVFKGIKNKILKPIGRFIKKHKKLLLTAALITGLVFTGGALAGANFASGFAGVTGINAGAYGASAAASAGVTSTQLAAANSAIAAGTTTGNAAAMAAANAGVTAAQLNAANLAYTSSLTASGVTPGFVGPLAPGTASAATSAATGANISGLSSAAGQAAYTSAGTIGTQTAMTALAGTPEEPFRPGSPRFSRTGIGQRYDRTTESLNFGVGGTTVNPYGGYRYG